MGNISGRDLVNNPDLQVGVKQKTNVLLPGVLTPVIEKQSCQIGQGLKPRKRFVYCDPRPEACLAADRAVVIDGISFNYEVAADRNYKPYRI